MRTAKKSKKSGSNQSSATPLRLAPQPETPLALFLRTATHELSNVIGTVIGELDYGLSNPNPSVKTRAMTVALQAAERARSLARNVSYFALNTSTPPQNYSVSQLVADTIELNQSEFLHRRVRVKTSLDSHASRAGDGSAVQQALLNIFRRALSTMPQGGSIVVQVESKNGGIEVSVQDDGVGLTEQRVHHLLEPDLTVASGHQDPDDLELLVSRLLIENQGGKLEIHSQLGEGTRYSLWFPQEGRQVHVDFVENRRYRRVQAGLPVEISFNGFAPFRTEIETLSVGGCFAKVTDPQAKLPQQESTGSLKIFYYQDQVLDIHRCRIASVGSLRGVPGLGIEFLELDPKAEKVLRAIVHSHGFHLAG